MDDYETVATTKQEWRDKNRGLTVALSACLALWLFAIMLIMHH